MPLSKESMKKILLLAGIILSAVFLAGGLYLLEKQDRELARQSEALAEKAEPLVWEQRERKQELDVLEEQLQRQEYGLGSVVIIFTELREEIYTEAYPVLQEAGYPAVLAVTDREYPGGEGCIRPEQYEELRSAGWETCVRWDGEQPLEGYMEQLREIFAGLQTAVPEAIYISDGRYTASCDTLVREAGFRTVIHHGEDGRGIITLGYEEEMWHAGAMPWNQNGVKTTISSAASGGGNLILTVDFQEGSALFEADKFPRLCEYLKQCGENLFVTDLEGALEYRREVADSGVDLELVAARQRLLEEIEELEREIAAIYGRSQ